MKCLNCNKEFESVRSTAKYCSDKCRVTASRNVSVTTDNGLSVSINDAVSVSDTPIDTVMEQVLDTISNQLPANFGQDDCQCLHCKQIKLVNPKARLNHGDYMSASELVANGYTYNRQALPGDIDYIGVKSNTMNQEYINV